MQSLLGQSLGSSGTADLSPKSSSSLPLSTTSLFSNFNMANSGGGNNSNSNQLSSSLSSSSLNNNNGSSVSMTVIKNLSIKDLNLMPLPKIFMDDLFSAWFGMEETIEALKSTLQMGLEKDGKIMPQRSLEPSQSQESFLSDMSVGDQMESFGVNGSMPPVSPKTKTNKLYHQSESINNDLTAVASASNPVIQAEDGKRVGLLSLGLSTGMDVDEGKENELTSPFGTVSMSNLSQTDSGSEITMTPIEANPIRDSANFSTLALDKKASSEADVSTTATATARDPNAIPSFYFPNGKPMAKMEERKKRHSILVHLPTDSLYCDVPLIFSLIY